MKSWTTIVEEQRGKKAQFEDHLGNKTGENVVELAVRGEQELA